MVRPVAAADRAEWLRLRHALWPGETGLGEEADDICEGSTMIKQVLVHDRGDGRLGGFIEIGERPYAEGCDTSPVSFIEGWYVDEDLRRTGVGRNLIRSAEDWARASGYREMGSDLVLGNDRSLKAHLALGYRRSD